MMWLAERRWQEAEKGCLVQSGLMALVHLARWYTSQHRVLAELAASSKKDCNGGVRVMKMRVGFGCAVETGTMPKREQRSTGTNRRRRK